MQLLTTSVKTSYVTLLICQYWSSLDQIEYTWSKIQEEGKVLDGRKKTQSWFEPLTTDKPPTHPTVNA